MAVNLSKGQKIDLRKDNGEELLSFCVGANWGAIEKKFLFAFSTTEAVDLDLSAIVFDENKNFLNVVYYGNLEMEGIRHSGDDLVGDVSKNDGLDNEVISVDLQKVPSNVAQIVFVLNSYKKQDFATIPFATIRLYEGTPTEVKKVFAVYNVASDPRFAGHVSMVLGKLFKENGKWKFKAIGEATTDPDLKSTIMSVAREFLD